MTLFRKSMLGALAAIVLAGGRFLLIAIVTRRLTPDAFGQFAYAQWLVDIVFLVTALGVPGVVSRYLAEYTGDSDRKLAFTRYWLPWALGLPVLAGLTTVVLASLSGVELTSTGRIFLGMWSVAAGWWAMQTAALIGQQRFKSILSSYVLAIAVMLPGAVLVPIGDSSPEPLFLVMAIASLAACSVGLRRTISQVTVGEPSSTGLLPLESIRVYAANIWATGLLWSLVWSRGEIPLVRLHLGDQGVAQYTAALTIYFGAVQGIMLWVGGIAPHLTSLLASGRIGEAESIARRFSDFQLLVSGCAVLGLVAIGPELLRAAFGTAYQTSASPMAILLIGLIAISASAKNHILQIATNARFSRNTSLVGLAVLYGVGVVAIPWLGLAGAAVSRVITMGVLFGISMLAMRTVLARRALDARNASIAIGVVTIPALIAAVGQSTLFERVLIVLPCFASLFVLLRAENGSLVFTDAAGVVWDRLRGLVPSIITRNRSSNAP